MVRPLEQGEECGRLLQDVKEPCPFRKHCPFGEHPSGCRRADHESAANLSFHIPYGAVAKGPINIDQVAVAVDGNELIFAPAGLSALHYVLDQRTDDGPYLGPAFRAGLAQGGRMLVRADAWPVGIVIELDQIFTPPQEHGLARAEQRIYRGKKQLRPVPDIADGSLAPVEGANPIRHLARSID